jgi:hypothetical protein
MALKLPRLPGNKKIVNPDGTATIEFSSWWQSFAQQIEISVNGIQAALDAAAAANAAADAASTAADAANTAASTAQDAADTASSDNAIANSGAVGLTLTATDVGASVTVAISSHTRVYADGTSVAVTGGSITGLAYSTAYYFFYNDPFHTGGVVAYHYSTNQADMIQSGDVHAIGAVTTPAAASPPKDGNVRLAPGVVEP